MGREATKAAGNPWYEARINAAKYDDRLKSREGAADLLGMSVSSITDAELSLSKCMPVDKAVLMADLYKAPNLLNYYCLHECPIGRNQPISDQVVSIERVTVRLIKNLRLDQLHDVKDKLVDIAEDGVISEEEKPELREIINYLDGVARTISELRIVGKMALGGLEQK